MLFHKLVVLLAVLNSAGPVLAQRIAPLAPVVPVAATQPRLGGTLSFQSSARLTTLPADQPPRTIRPQPVFLINSAFLIGSSLGKINPQKITGIKVYKGRDTPARWRGLTANDLIAITLKPHTRTLFKTESLKDIRKRLGLKGPVTYQLEGLPIDDPTLRVVTADIARFDAQPVAGSTVVNIHLAVPPPAVHPPGTIMLRGTTGL